MLCLFFEHCWSIHKHFMGITPCSFIEFTPISLNRCKDVDMWMSYSLRFSNIFSFWRCQDESRVSVFSCSCGVFPTEVLEAGSLGQKVNAYVLGLERPSSFAVSPVSSGDNLQAGCTCSPDLRPGTYGFCAHWSWLLREEKPDRTAVCPAGVRLRHCGTLCGYFTSFSWEEWGNVRCCRLLRGGALLSLSLGVVDSIFDLVSVSWITGHCHLCFRT